ncbi:MAG: DUF4388 domain-containing protein [Thermodesulfovibrio sp.]|nr:DUF4388 domain-containing protein [Thermodesulfovibrio sp.]MCX7724717.1 DUF4388 domain-containing protein [Thermodesulfovibrio sp.]MDW7971908.1 hypothetical protein [Thermodesulfovibrio sp.]
MTKSLADVIEGLYKNKSTGVLTVIFSENKNLLKFYFKEGEVYHISFGLKKGIQCLYEIKFDNSFSCQFIPQISVNVESETLSTEEIIKYLKSMNNFVNSESFSSLEFQKIKDAIKTALIRQLGPIGSKIIDKYIAERWILTTPPSRKDFFNLINFLKDEIEDPISKDEFLNEVSNFIEKEYK